MAQLLIATNNRGKVRELQEIFASLPAELVTPQDLGLDLDVAETGRTYAENARLKAEAFARASGLVALADDSGLEVDALDGAPGLHSARYAGPGVSDADRRAKLLHELRQVPPPRLARFRCVVAVAVPAKLAAPDILAAPGIRAAPAADTAPDIRLELFEGACEGEIILEERGSGGFGYDPIFFMPEHGRTMAELPPEIKNRVSHRARAAQAALPFLRRLAGAE